MSYPDHSMSLGIDLAIALGNRFQKTGPMTDLEEAISLYRESLSLYPMSHPDRFISLRDLAAALNDRFRETGSINDLEEVS